MHLSAADKKAAREGFKYLVLSPSGGRKCYCTSSSEAKRECGKGGKIVLLSHGRYAARNPYGSLNVRNPSADEGFDAIVNELSLLFARQGGIRRDLGIDERKQFYIKVASKFAEVLLEFAKTFPWSSIQTNSASFPSIPIVSERYPLGWGLYEREMAKTEEGRKKSAAALRSAGGVAPNLLKKGGEFVTAVLFAWGPRIEFRIRTFVSVDGDVGKFQFRRDPFGHGDPLWNTPVPWATPSQPTNAVALGKTLAKEVKSIVKERDRLDAKKRNPYGSLNVRNPRNRRYVVAYGGGDTAPLGSFASKAEAKAAMHAKVAQGKIVGGYVALAKPKYRNPEHGSLNVRR